MRVGSSVAKLWVKVNARGRSLPGGHLLPLANQPFLEANRGRACLQQGRESSFDRQIKIGGRCRLLDESPAERCRGIDRFSEPQQLACPTPADQARQQR